MLRSTGLNHIAEEAPLVDYLKALADELDDGFDPKTRAQYLAALKDVRRVLTYNARPKSSADSGAPAEPAEPPSEEASQDEAPPKVNSLAAFRAAKGIG